MKNHRISTALLLAVSGLFPLSHAQAWGRHAGGGGGSSSRRPSSGTPSAGPKAVCIPSDAVAAGAPTPAASAATSAAAPSSLLASAAPLTGAAPAAGGAAPIDGYVVELQRGQGDQGVLAAQLFFGTVAAGRSRLAGYADVSSQGAAGSDQGMDLKSTAESPFRFELTIAATQDTQGAFDANLVDADLFTGAPLANVPYKCWFQR